MHARSSSAPAAQAKRAAPQKGAARTNALERLRAGRDARGRPIFAERRNERRRLPVALDQHDVQDFPEAADGDHLEVTEDRLWHLLEVRLVLLRQYDRLDAGLVGGE